MRGIEMTNNRVDSIGGWDKSHGAAHANGHGDISALGGIISS
jgi:hypothetical protein